MTTPSSRLRRARDDANQRVDDFFSRGPTRRALRSLYWGMVEHHAGSIANAMAFDLFLAMIPLLALAGWVLGVVVKRYPSALDSITTLLQLAPTDVQEVLMQQLGRFADTTALAPVSALGALWLTSGAFNTAMTVFEPALKAAPRPWWKRRLISLGCATFLVAAAPAVAWLAVSVAGGPVAILHAVLENETADLKLARGLAIGVTLVGMTAFIAGFFRVGVSRPGVTRRVWPGAISAVAIGSVASWGFSAYVSNLSRFPLFYGSLTTMAVLLLWLWLCCAALLTGAEINAQLEGVRRDSIPSNGNGAVRPSVPPQAPRA